MSKLVLILTINLRQHLLIKEDLSSAQIQIDLLLLVHKSIFFLHCLELGCEQEIGNLNIIASKMPCCMKNDMFGSFLQRLLYNKLHTIKLKL